jgi:hypothetical protein
LQRLRPLPRPQLRQRQWQALLAVTSLAVLLGAMMFQLGRLGDALSMWKTMENQQMPQKSRHEMAI